MILCGGNASCWYIYYRMVENTRDGERSHLLDSWGFVSVPSALRKFLRVLPTAEGELKLRKGLVFGGLVSWTCIGPWYLAKALFNGWLSFWWSTNQPYYSGNVGSHWRHLTRWVLQRSGNVTMMENLQIGEVAPWWLLFSFCFYCSWCWILNFAEPTSLVVAERASWLDWHSNEWKVCDSCHCHCRAGQDEEDSPFWFKTAQHQHFEKPHQESSHWGRQSCGPRVNSQLPICIHIFCINNYSLSSLPASPLPNNTAVLLPISDTTSNLVSPKVTVRISNCLFELAKRLHCIQNLFHRNSLILYLGSLPLSVESGGGMRTQLCRKII